MIVRQRGQNTWFHPCCHVIHLFINHKSFTKKNLVCDKGLYGYDCKETCGYCRDVNQCSNLNGTCLTGCVAGFKKGLCKTCKYYIDVCYCKMILVIQNTFHLNECYHSNLSYHHNSHTIVHVDKLHFFMYS